MQTAPSVREWEYSEGEDDIRLMEKLLTGPEKGQCDKQRGSGYILIKDFVLKLVMTLP